ncbi:MAG: ornithine cyclodeaminase family protein [Pseudomonadales bacterium]
MTVIIKREEIAHCIPKIDLTAAMEQAFIAYSAGESVVPPVAELLFDNPVGDTHIKYGYIKEQAFFVVKIASGFYDNPALGLSSSQGLMLLFSQRTGEPVAVLLDEGSLTDLRTAAAGAVAAKYFAPSQIEAYGIIGTGIQAREQLRQLVALHTEHVSPCRNIWLWGRSNEKAQALASELRAEFGAAFHVQIAQSPAQVAANANLIVTTTPSEQALLSAKDIRPGTHITAVGADTEHKRELSSDILARADIVVSDSLPQCQSRGEIFRAMADGAIELSQVVELGNTLENASLRRQDDTQITVVDLTGVAVQDIAIASAVYNHLHTAKDI